MTLRGIANWIGAHGGATVAKYRFGYSERIWVCVAPRGLADPLGEAAAVPSAIYDRAQAEARAISMRLVVQARLAITHALHEAVRSVDLVFHAAGTNLKLVA
jgi:hypothetical protein